MQTKNQEIYFQRQAGHLFPCEPNSFDPLKEPLRIVLHARQWHGESPVQFDSSRMIGAMVVAHFMALANLDGQCVSMFQMAEQGGKIIARAQNQILGLLDVAPADNDV